MSAAPNSRWRIERWWRRFAVEIWILPFQPEGLGSRSDSAEMADLLTGLKPEAGNTGEPLFQQDLNFQPRQKLTGADMRARLTTFPLQVMFPEAPTRENLQWLLAR